MRIIERLLMGLVMLGLLFSMASCCCAGGSDDIDDDDLNLPGTHDEGTGGNT